jgi:exosortase K
MTNRCWDAALLGGVLGAAFLVKRHYSVASAAELDWLLGPTAALVERASGYRFVRREGLGYLSSELGLLIAPACAGINYLVIALSALTFGFVRRMGTPARKFAWIGGSALLAYGMTLGVNAARIALSVALRPWSCPELHRIVGIVVYLSSLLALYWVVERILGRCRNGSLAMVGLPLGCYLGVTLLIPLVRGAHVHPEYWRHAGVVLLTAVVLGGLAAAIAPRRTSGHQHFVPLADGPARDQAVGHERVEADE